MFWLLDIYFSKNIDLRRSNEFKKELFYFDNSCMRIVFLPRKTSIEKAKKYSLIPNTWEVLVYEWPFNLFSCVPFDMPKAQEILARDVENFYLKNKYKFNKKVKVLWISQWIYPAFYIANNIISSDKFIAVTPASRWEDAIFNSKAVFKVKNEALKNWYSYHDYKNCLNKTNPIDNIKNLPDDIEIYYWFWDRYIMSNLSSEIVLEMKKIWKKPKVFKNYIFWHFLTILNFWKKLKSWKI